MPSRRSSSRRAKRPNSSGASTNRNRNVALPDTPWSALPPEPSTPPHQVEPQPSTPPPRNRVSRIRGSNRRTTVEDTDENDSQNMSREAADVGKASSPPRTPLPRTGSSGSVGNRSPGRPRPPMDTPCAYTSTPITKKVNGQQGARHPNKAAAVYSRHADEARKYITGPMPVQQFTNTFLPPAAQEMPNPVGAFDAVPTSASTENEFLHPLVEGIESGGFCPSVAFLDTSTSGEQHGTGELKPDVTGYDRGDVGLLEQITNLRSKMLKARYRANLGFTEILIEGKARTDPFRDTHNHDGGQSFLAFGETDSQEKEVFGQVVAYAVECCSRQHRVFFFSILIIGTKARLFRWDRAGIIVTESFDYRKDPELLCEFLWRFHHANPVQRGFDPSVVIASEEEEKLFKGLIAEEVSFQMGIDLNDEKLNDVLKRHYQEGKVTKVNVYGRDGSVQYECLVSVPVSSPRGSTGRSTRGYWGVMLTAPGTGKVVFLKDTWRVDVDRVTEEGVVYDDMMKHEVVNVSSMLVCGDVMYEEGEGPRQYVSAPPDSGLSWTSHNETGQDGAFEVPATAQSTLAQDFIDADWVCSCLKTGKHSLHSRVVKHTHYRMILGEVGCSLSDFAGSRELFEAARDVLHALMSAYKKCGRLHRDVSFGNIILVRCRVTKCRKGILIDWEFSTRIDRMGRAADYLRSGTWAYMSVASLNPRIRDFKHTQGDDLESLLYVVISASVQWVPHGYAGNLGRWMYQFFDEAFISIEDDAGGLVKGKYMSLEMDFGDDFQFRNEHVDAFFRRMYVDLKTNHQLFKESGKELRWTTENVSKHFDDVCQGLSATDGADRDKCFNKVDGFYVEVKPEPRATHTPSRGTGSHLSDLPPTDLVNNPSQRGSKRTVHEGEDRHDGTVGNESIDVAREGSKRQRFEGRGEESATSGGDELWAPGPPSTLSILPESSRRISRALTDGASTSNRYRTSSRHVSRTSSKGVRRRRSSRLSAKSSSSSVGTAVRRTRSNVSKRSV